jgi:hypothetical protein
MDFTADWFSTFMNHTFFLLPLCVHAALPIWGPPSSSELIVLLSKPLPAPMQQLWHYRLTFLSLFVLCVGSYAIDSKNGWSFFPGSPCFKRVLYKKLTENDPEGKFMAAIDLIRGWVIDNKPSTVTSTHWWMSGLPKDVFDAFNSIAYSDRAMAMFRELFSERHYVVEVVDGMNEIYVTGPPRFDEAANSDQIFDMRHVDGPWGWIPFVSVYRCLVGMDRNHVVSADMM